MTLGTKKATLYLPSLDITVQYVSMGADMSVCAGVPGTEFLAHKER